MSQKLQRASALDGQLRLWREQVPPHLWSEERDNSQVSLNPRRPASFIKKQSVVLRLRMSYPQVSLTLTPARYLLNPTSSIGYLNLRMVIHAVFMVDPAEVAPEEATALSEARCRCIEAASDSIDLIYSTFQTDEFFQTWYVVFFLLLNTPTHTPPSYTYHPRSTDRFTNPVLDTT